MTGDCDAQTAQRQQETAAESRERSLLGIDAAFALLAIPAVVLVAVQAVPLQEQCRLQ